MTANMPPRNKKFYTPAQANATLPLVRRIVEDVTALARELRGQHQRLVQLQAVGKRSPEGHEQELAALEAEFERGQARMEELRGELTTLGIELKDYFMGLIDFPCWMDGREVYLCWKLGEDEVAHWHEVEAGFAGRQKLYQEARLG